MHTFFVAKKTEMPCEMIYSLKRILKSHVKMHTFYGSDAEITRKNEYILLSECCNLIQKCIQTVGQMLKSHLNA